MTAQQKAWAIEDLKAWLISKRPKTEPLTVADYKPEQTQDHNGIPE